MTEKKHYLRMALLCAALVVIGFATYGSYSKYITLLAGLATIALLYLADLRPLKNLASLALAAFVCFNGFTICWAMSGKFFLREYSKIFIAMGVFLLVVLFQKGREGYEKCVCEVLAGFSACHAVLNVEAGATGLSERVLGSFDFMGGIGLGFEQGTRLTGILGNANVSSSLLAVGVLMSVALLCAAEEEKERRIYAAFLAVNAFALLLAFSMGALACFALSVVVYLICAGRRRGEVLLHMLCGAVPTAACAFAAFPFFGREGVLRVVPLLLLAADAALVVWLEENPVQRLEGFFGKNQMVVFGALAALALLLAGYVFAGLRVSGPYTFGDPLRRGFYPAPGDYTLSVAADGDVSVTVVSQNRAQTMMHTDTVLYDGGAANAAFTVPEDSLVCYVTFSAEPGVKISAASAGDTKIPLNYTLLPGFIANRLQGLRANQNAIQRVVFMADGLKLFRLSPVVGNGVGSFETGITRVQDFYYETRFVHNHYVQILLESGVIGLALWLAALAGLCVLLWRGRKTARQPWLYGALAASFLMVVTHEFVEVSMSYVVFLCFAYAVFGLIVRTCGTVDEQPAVGKKGVKTVKHGASNVVAAALPAIFLLTLCGNLVANYMARLPVTSPEGSFKNLENAEKLDAYERMDMLLTYVSRAQELGDEKWYPQANVYAEQLSKVQSNSIPQYLVSYYLLTEQYEKGIEAAKLGAAYSASDARVWNGCTMYLRLIFREMGEDSPLYGEDGEHLRGLLLEYYDMLLQHNANAMEPIVLDADNQAFFEWL